MKIIIAALAASMFALTGCESIQTHEQLVQPVDTELEAYVGGVILKINRTRDLPNAMGKADLFGGKVYAGYTELRYRGVSEDSCLMLRVTEVETHSTETTMSKYGQTSTSYSGHTDANGNTTGYATTSQPAEGHTETLPPNSTDVKFNPATGEEFTIAGVRVKFIKYTQQKIRYKLQSEPKQQPN